MRRPSPERRGPERREGSATIQALVVVVLVTAVIGAVAVFMMTAMRLLEGSATNAEREEATALVLRDVVKALEADATPDSDSIPDLGKFSQGFADGTKVVVSDVSSKLNPNYAKAGLLASSGLAKLMKPGKSVAELEQYRFDKGPSEDIVKAYGDFFTKDAFERYLTPYGYANVNSADEFALEKLYTAITGKSPTFGTFRNRLSELRSKAEVLAPAEYDAFFGIDGQEVFPAMCAEPQLNVNYLDSFLLKEILEYPAFKIDKPGERAFAIAIEASTGEIGPRRLVELVGKPEGHPIYGYLGVRTWFWRVEISTKGKRNVIILARIPDYSVGAKKKYKVVSMETQEI